MFLGAFLLSQHYYAVRLSYQIQNQDAFTPQHESGFVSQRQSSQGQWKDSACTTVTSLLMTQKPALRPILSQNSSASESLIRICLISHLRESLKVISSSSSYLCRCSTSSGCSVRMTTQRKRAMA